MRYKLIIEYEGSSFHGWQKQEGVKTIQGALEHALYRFLGKQVEVFGAGRTDAGVHALGQVAHFDCTDVIYSEHTALRAINFYLQDVPISVISVAKVTEDFHARFSAVARVYEYRIINRASKLVLDDGRAWLVRFPLDISFMQSAADALIGEHDFSSFCDSESQAKKRIRTIKALSVHREDNENVTVIVEAKSFLHKQVRIMVGTMVDLASRCHDEISIKRMVAEMLSQKSRKAAGRTAPACGLYFKEVKY